MRQVLRGVLEFFVLLLASCAQMVPPTGGPKDTTPPKTVSCSPDNKSTRFLGNTILIKFNKYIQLKDLQSQLVVSPPLKQFPIARIKKGKELELELRDTLESNTTYTFNFGNAIADITEGNIATGFKYVFSTGSFIDSLKVTGIVRDAFTQEVQKDALVMLYGDQSDSAPYKKLPSYCAHTDANGYYVIENVKNASYRIVVLSKSQNGYSYQPYSENMGFAANPIQLVKNDTENLALFLEEQPSLHLTKARAVERGHIQLIFNKPADSLIIKTLNLPEGKTSYALLQYSTSHDTVHYWLNTPNLDSLRFIVNRNGKSIDTAVIYSFPGKAQGKKETKPVPLKLILSAHNKQSDYDFHNPIMIKAAHPIMKYNPGKIFITHGHDTIKFTTDTTGMPFAVKLSCKFTSDSTYRLLLLPGTFTDIFGQANDTTIAQFKIQEATYFGSLKLNLKFNVQGNYLVQLLDGQGNVCRQDKVSAAKTISYDALPPATYRLRVVVDANNDGKWTTGNYLKKIQPEKIFYYYQPVSIRSNWDLTQEWIVK